MSFAIQLTALLASGTEATQDRLLGYPKAGIPAGQPAIIQVTATWDGQGAPSPGWSTYKGSSRQHPTLTQFATPIDLDASAAMGNGRRARLSALEQTKMAADLASAVVSLPGDWLPNPLPVGIEDTKDKRT